MSSLTFDKREVLLQLELCSNCGICMAFKTLKYCPQINISEELYNVDPLDRALKIIKARSRIKELLDVGQDGGVVSTICYMLLSTGTVKYVLSCKFGKGLVVALPEVATKPEDVVHLAKSKYVYVPVLALLGKVKTEPTCVVGLPCHMRALSILEREEKIEFIKISILCSSNFRQEFIQDILKREGKKVEDIAKMEVKRKFKITFKDGKEVEIPLEEAKKMSFKCCRQCPELISNYADIAVGSMFLPEKWNFIVILTKRGEEIVNEAINRGVLEVKNIERDVLNKVRSVARRKREEGKKVRQEVVQILREKGLLQ